MDLFVKRCLEIVEHVGFDGWLINVENEIPAKDVDKLIAIIRELSKHCHVIWYDAVTIEGKMEWQSELNEKNKLFFDACHGIFLNYYWNETTLRTSVDNAGLSRQHDVYVGIDVFGRGTPGGGGFRTNLALSWIREYNLSAAIFGPGWTRYVKTDNEDFFTMNKIFWQLLEPYLYMHGPADPAGFETGFKSGCLPQENKLWQLDLANQELMPSFMASEVLYKQFSQTGSGCALNHWRTDLFVCEIPVQSRLSFVINLDQEVDSKSIELKLIFDLTTQVNLNQTSQKTIEAGNHELTFTIVNEAGKLSILNLVAIDIKIPGCSVILKKFAVRNINSVVP